MTTTLSRFVLIALFIIAGSAPLAADEPPDQAKIENALKAAKITLPTAMEKSQQAAKEGVLVAAELRSDEASPLFQMNFLVGGQIREYRLDGVKGEFLPSRARPVADEHQQWAAELPKVRDKWKVSPAQAIRSAEKKLGSATAFAVRCELEEGQWSWRVLLLAGADLTLVRIDPISGEITKTSRIGAEAAPAVVWDFDRTSADLPPDWTVRQTHPTKALATWKVIADPSAPSPGSVLALTQTENFDGTFNLAIAGKPLYKDLDLTVRVKAVSGKEDQGGGPIWRCKDENNYYICRVNPLESNFRVYYVKDGKRKQLESVKVESVAGQWYTIHVSMIGPKIICQLDGKTTLEAQDSAFPDAGMVGLWTKADAVTSFDDLSVSEITGSNKPAPTSEK